MIDIPYLYRHDYIALKKQRYAWIRREPFFFFSLDEEISRFLREASFRRFSRYTARPRVGEENGRRRSRTEGMSSPRLLAPYPRRNFSVLASYTLISARFGTREKSCTPRKSTTVYDGRPRPRAWNVTPEGTRPVSASFQIARTPFLRAWRDFRSGSIP